MRKVKKSIVCVLLIFTLLCGAFESQAFAQSLPAADSLPLLADAFLQTDSNLENGNGHAPVATIILPGISQSDATYCDENGTPILNEKGEKQSGGLLILKTDGLVKKILKHLLWPLLSTLFTQRTHKNLAAGTRTVVDHLFSIQATTQTGDPVNNLVLNTYPFPLSEYDADSKEWFYRRLPMEPVIDAMTQAYGVNGEKYTYLYTFPLIGDPMKSGEALFDFIDLVKEQTGCRKVNLVAISMGGTILSAYLDLVREKQQEDYSDINKIINVVACLDGTDLFADFYARNWNLSDDYLYGSYIPTIMAEEGNQPWVGHAINIALRLLPKKALYTVLTAAFDGILDNLILHCPQFWSLVPSDRYEALANRYFSDAQFALLRERTDRFQQARLNLKSNLSCAAAQNGVGIYSVCGYGRQYDSGDYCFFGITASSASSNSDSIIDIDSTSLGATYAPAGRVLDSSGAALSPDKELDLSTCLFPDTTWFFRGQHHEVGRNDVVIRLLGEILVGKVSDAAACEPYPQFNGNRNTRTLCRPGGLMDQAQTVLANAQGLYTQAQIDAVRPVYEQAAAFLAQTVLDENAPEEAQRLTLALNDALAVTGLTQKTEPPKSYEQLLNKLLTALDSHLMQSVGGRGYSDQARQILFPWQ